MNANELKNCYEYALSRMTQDLGISFHLKDSQCIYFPVIIGTFNNKHPNGIVYQIVDYSKMLNDKDNKEHLIKDLIDFIEHGNITQFLLDVDKKKFLTAYSKYMRCISINTFNTVLDNSIAAMKQLKLDLDLAKMINLVNNIDK